ncbi:hypothetical protein FOC4_g10000435 [Fusarium odoratissimum]|uniref:Uncharacterized protein n=1 Tax=Fusarium oxysporum f. sp. cubense (strain race 4) TaxID=2502994 RepID=N1S2C3_FUSC4|nr:hypothetical protein FOC4_g10000435 [Fusarium odoratissimum]
MPAIDNSPRPSLIDQLSESASDSNHMDQRMQPLNHDYIMDWYEELADQVTQPSATLVLREQDGRRYTVLMAACRYRDIFYVIFHQLCCLWSRDKADVYEIFGSRVTPHAIDFTFNEMQRILNNHDLSIANLRWFANFPCPSKELFTAFPEASLAVQLARFIVKFSAHWESLLDQAEAEDRPVAGSVLRSRLHCASPVLRYILFVTSSLQIGIVTGPDASTLDHQFDEDEGEWFGVRGETVRQALAFEHAGFVHRQMPS